VNDLWHQRMGHERASGPGDSLVSTAWPALDTPCVELSRSPFLEWPEMCHGVLSQAVGWGFALNGEISDICLVDSMRHCLQTLSE
jgi:hypothetical protein